MARREAPPDAFGRSAREYEQGRPEWPEELLERVVSELGLGIQDEVLDLGAGTGKLTRSLVPRFARVVAVEPDDAMRDVLEEIVPAAEALPGNAEAIPLADSSVDAVFSAEAFHWFATDVAVAEIVRVLRPRGAFGIFWNYPLKDDDMGEEAERVIKAAIERGGEPGLARVLSNEWRRPLGAAPFEPLREAEIERDFVSSRDEWIANMLSVSSIAHQPDEVRATFAEQLRELIPVDRRVHRRFRTVAYWTRLA